MAGPKVLIPYNFTRHDEKCVDFAIQRYGASPTTQFTIFHTYIPVPDVDISDKTVMGRLAGNLTYLHQKITECNETIKNVCQDFD